jgi:glycosyltransferase involved in cell wall biosynthesis
VAPPIRIAYYTDARSTGGAEALLGTLLAGLGPGFDPIVVGVDSGVASWVAAHRPGTATRVLRPVQDRRDVAGFLGHLQMLARLRASGVEIFQANLPVPASCQYVLAAATLIPALQTVALEHLPYPVDGARQRRLKQITSGRLAAHVAVGDAVARQVEHLAGLRPGSIRTIRGGVADRPLNPARRVFTDGPILGSIGRLDRQKGYDVLLVALARLPDARLVLVGDGPERNALERLAGELGVRPRVHFAGRRADARDQLSAFDVFVLPSRFEGFPLAILEAMLAGVPVVATSVGSVAEAVLDGVTGSLVAPDDPGALTDALGRLLADVSARARLGKAGRRHALGFTQASMTAAYEALYSELVGR